MKRKLRKATMVIEVDDAMQCICIDGMESVREVAPFAKLFPSGTIYGGGICIHYDKVPKEEILKALKPFNLKQVKAA